MVYPVVINIYDLSPYNNYLIKIGLGMYHTGVEVNGREYTFGGHPGLVSTGVFDHEPWEMEQELYRGSLEIGTIDSLAQLHDVLKDIKDDFMANEYNVIKKNCNHFSDEFCKRLVGRGIPGYINRLAKMGSCCR